jgi:hypothetical protein
MGEGRRAVAQLAEHRRGDEAPQPVSRDFAEEITQPPAIEPKVDEPGGDIDEVRSPNELDLEPHRHPRPRRVVLFAGVHAALQSLGRPRERLQHSRGHACALGHVWVAAVGVQADVMQPARAQQQFAIELPVAGKPLGDRELAQAVSLHRAVCSRRGTQRFKGRPSGRGGGQRVGVDDGEPSDAAEPALVDGARAAVARAGLGDCAVPTRRPVVRSHSRTSPRPSRRHLAPCGAQRCCPLRAPPRRCDARGGRGKPCQPSARVLPGDLIRTVSARLWRLERWAVGPGGGRRFGRPACGSQGSRGPSDLGADCVCGEPEEVRRLVVAVDVCRDPPALTARAR